MDESVGNLERILKSLRSRILEEASRRVRLLKSHESEGEISRTGRCKLACLEQYLTKAFRNEDGKNLKGSLGAKNIEISIFLFVKEEKLFRL